MLAPWRCCNASIFAHCAFFALMPQPLANGSSSEGPTVCPEWGAGLMSTLTFSWLSPLIRKGYKTPLQDKDIWSLPPTDR
jgi:hypothetical protein